MTKRIGIAAAFAGMLLAASNPQTFTGVITDTMCGKSHSMTPGKPDETCIAMCVKGPAQYALYDGRDVLKLSDQKTPARFAAKRVKVMGVLDEKTKTIKVTSIQAE